MKKALVLALMLVLVMSVGAYAKTVGSELTINLKVLPWVEIEAPTVLNFKVNGNEGKDEQVANVTIRSNSPMTYTVESAGFQSGIGETAMLELLNKAVIYYIGKAHKFQPTGGISGKLDRTNGTLKIPFVLSYTPNDWTKIFADDYRDVITWTVTAVN